MLQPGTIGWDSDTGYTGELGDTTAGLWNFYARSYDPTAASWLQADPYRGARNDPGTLSRYQYVTGKPTTFTDAFGYRLTQSSTSKYVGGSLKTCQREYGFCPTSNGATVTGPTPSSNRSQVSVRHDPPPAFPVFCPDATCPTSDPWCAIFGDMSDSWGNLSNLSHGVFDTLTWSPLIGLIVAGDPFWSFTGVLFPAPPANGFYFYGSAAAGLAAGGGAGGAKSVTGVLKPTRGLTIPPTIAKPAAPPSSTVLPPAAKAPPKAPQTFLTPTNPAQVPPASIPAGWRVRVVGPSELYPGGYWRLEKPLSNGGWQGIDPSTMKPGTQAETHVPLPGQE